MSRIYNSRGLFAALEDGDLDLDDNIEASDEIPAEVYQSAEEVNEESEAIERLFIAIEEAEEEIGDMEKITDIAEDSLAKDETTGEEGPGLDENAAEIAEVAIERISHRLGIRRPRSIMPATESFGSDRSRRTATRVAIEGVKDTIQESIKNIWALIKKGIQAIVDFYQKYLKALDFIKTAIDRFEKALKDAKYNEKPKSENVRLSTSVIRNLSVDGELSVGTIGVLTKNTIAFSKGVSKATVAVASAFGSAKPDLEKILKAVEFATSESEGESSDSGALPGNRIFRFVKGAQEGAAKIRAEVTDWSKKTFTSEEVGTLTPVDAKILTKGLNELLKVSVTYDRDAGLLKEINKKLEGLAKNPGDDELSKEERADIKSSITAYLTATRLAPTLAVALARATIEYISASLKQYG